MRFGSNDYRLTLRGYSSEDMFPIIGRNGSALVQPGPNMKMNNEFPSKGQGTIIKDSQEGSLNLSFSPVYASSGSQNIRFNTPRGYTCWEVARNSGTIFKQESHGQDIFYENFISSIGKSTYPMEDGYFMATPVPSSYSRLRVVGNGGKPINVRFYNEEDYYFIYTTQIIYRMEVYVVIRATSTELLTPGMLDDNIIRPYVLTNQNTSSFGSVWATSLYKAYSWYRPYRPSETDSWVQVWYGLSTADILSGGAVSLPIILMQNGSSMVSRNVRINIQTTYLLKDD